MSVNSSVSKVLAGVDCLNPARHGPLCCDYDKWLEETDSKGKPKNFPRRIPAGLQKRLAKGISPDLESTLAVDFRRLNWKVSNSRKIGF